MIIDQEHKTDLYTCVCVCVYTTTYNKDIIRM